jgi:biopolymer transport protein ExbB
MMVYLLRIIVILWWAGQLLHSQESIVVSPAPPVAESPAQSAYQKAVESIDKDLEAELKRLAELRKKIAAEKPAIAKKAAESALTLRQKKRQYEIAKATQASVDQQLEERRRQLKLWRDERLYLDGQLADFTKNYRGAMTLPEVNSLDELLKNAQAGSDAGTQVSLDLVESLTKNLPQLARIRSIEGQALGTDGVMIDGKFAIAGPIAWFADHHGTASGLVRDSRSLKPELVAGSADLETIRALLDGKPAEVSFDPTLGSAIEMQEVEGDFITYVKKGGIWVYPIIFLAIVATIAAIAKWIQLMGIREIHSRQVEKVIELVNQRDLAGAKSAVNSIKHPARAILNQGIEVVDRPIDDIEESLYEKYLEALPKLTRGLPLIAIASATSPLLGLLGTVTGMIATFNQITIFGTGDARSLSGGISEALITTAFGLIVAIPALILHALLSRKVQGIRATMEMVSLAFINGLKKKVDGPI